MTAPDSRDFDAIIVGAGVIGTVMASLLVALKLSAPGRVAVIADRFAAAPPADADWDLRVFALSRASERLLGTCGVWDSLPAQRVFAYERMCVWDSGGDPNGKGSLRFDCAEMGEPNLGFIVDGRALQWQCLQAARNAGTVFMEAGIEAVGVPDGDISIRLSDSRILRSRLLIAADGQESKTRALLGVETAGHSYHQDALVAHVRTSKPHCSTAWQRFLAGGPLAFLPLPDGRSSIVWSAELPEAARLRALDREAFGAALTQASGGVLGDCELSTALKSFPLKLQYALEYVRPRAVLLGDAAHVVHPLAGQGLNLGLLDCAVLADVLGEAGGAGNFGEHRLLRRYERWRRSENQLAAAAFDGLERLFSTQAPLSAGLRIAGLSAVGKVPFIKRHLAKRALGLVDVPEFLKADRPSPRK
jgi:2-octaprenylphenol hydroxylase